MTQILDMENGNEIIKCIGTGTTGVLFDCSEEPAEVRIFSATSPNGDVTTAYSYADGKVELDAALSAGEVAKAYDDGSWFFSEQTFIKNVEAERQITNTLRIIDDAYTLKNIQIDLEELGFSDDVIEWDDDGTWSDTFPIVVSELAANTALDIDFRVTIDATDDNSNYRDIAFSISYRQEGTE